MLTHGAADTGFGGGPALKAGARQGQHAAGQSMGLYGQARDLSQVE